MKHIRPAGKNKNVKIIVDDEDYQYLSSTTWYLISSVSGNLYAVSRYKKDRMHNLIMKPKSGFVVDHINGNGLDNRRGNLRICTQSQNLMNKKRYKNTSRKYKGVFKHGRLWQAHISISGKNTYIGSYEKQIEAATAYDEKAREVYGEFANYNFAI